MGTPVARPPINCEPESNFCSNYTKTKVYALGSTCYSPRVNQTDLAVLGFHFTLQLAILAAIGGSYWQLSDVRERLVRVETQLQYTLPANPDRTGEQRP